MTPNSALSCASHLFGPQSYLTGGRTVADTEHFNQVSGDSKYLASQAQVSSASETPSEGFVSEEALVDGVFIRRENAQIFLSFPDRNMISLPQCLFETLSHISQSTPTIGRICLLEMLAWQYQCLFKELKGALHPSIVQGCESIVNSLTEIESWIAVCLAWNSCVKYHLNLDSDETFRLQSVEHHFETDSQIRLSFLLTNPFSCPTLFFIRSNLSRLKNVLSSPFQIGTYSRSQKTANWQSLAKDLKQQVIHLNNLRKQVVKLIDSIELCNQTPQLTLDILTLEYRQIFKSEFSSKDLLIQYAQIMDAYFSAHKRLPFHNVECSSTFQNLLKNPIGDERSFELKLRSLNANAIECDTFNDSMYLVMSDEDQRSPNIQCCEMQIFSLGYYVTANIFAERFALMIEEGEFCRSFSEPAFMNFAVWLELWERPSLQSWEIPKAFRKEIRVFLTRLSLLISKLPSIQSEKKMLQLACQRVFIEMLSGQEKQSNNLSFVSAVVYFTSYGSSCDFLLEFKKLTDTFTQTCGNASLACEEIDQLTFFLKSKGLEDSLNILQLLVEGFETLVFEKKFKGKTVIQELMKWLDLSKTRPFERLVSYEEPLELSLPSPCSVNLPSPLATLDKSVKTQSSRISSQHALILPESTASHETHTDSCEQNNDLVLTRVCPSLDKSSNSNASSAGSEVSEDVLSSERFDQIVQGEKDKSLVKKEIRKSLRKRADSVSSQGEDCTVHNNKEDEEWDPHIIHRLRDLGSMKKFLREKGVKTMREGRRHTVFASRGGRKIPLPRHPGIELSIGVRHSILKAIKNESEDSSSKAFKLQVVL